MSWPFPSFPVFELGQRLTCSFITSGNFGVDDWCNRWPVVTRLYSATYPVTGVSYTDISLAAEFSARLALMSAFLRHIVQPLKTYEPAVRIRLCMYLIWNRCIERLLILKCLLPPEDEGMTKTKTRLSYWSDGYQGSKWVAGIYVVSNNRLQEVAVQYMSMHRNTNIPSFSYPSTKCFR